MLLKLKNIGKIYNSNDILTIGIRNINLEFDYNEFVTIEGESGSGKSTLLNVIAANDSYEEGELYFNGEETSHYSNADWEKYRSNSIAMIFQDFNIIENLTVLENVELALLRIESKKERRKIACELIKRVGLKEQMHQRGSKLSGGEKQRTVIARALAQDSPIILADEPTGNLDVKASREIAALLKEVSKDKLVIVVTHNPEFFEKYATRRVEIYDGSVKEDKVIEKPTSQDIKINVPYITPKQQIKNTFRIGFLNYKSRPKFTALMSLALCCIAASLFAIMALMIEYLVLPLKTSLDDVGVEGKVIISNTDENISLDSLDEICYKTKANYFMYNRDMSEFKINIPKRNSMYKSYEITCIYDPIHHYVNEGEGLLIIPSAYIADYDEISSQITSAGAGIKTINVLSSKAESELVLYLSYNDMENNGKKIEAINTTMRIGSNTTTIYSFEEDDTLEDGSIKLVNSSFYNVKEQNVVLDIAPTKMFVISDDSETDKTTSGIIVRMSSNDYKNIFASSKASKQAAIYFASDEIAYAAIKLLPDGYIGMLSNGKVYVLNASQSFAMNLMWYGCLLLLSVLLAAVLYAIFMRSIKIYLSDFAIYKTLGISSMVSKASLYVQMVLIYLPTLVLLPIISLIATKIKYLALPFISVGNYFFIEGLLLFIILFVAYGFNKGIARSKISQVLRRGSKW